MRWRPGRHQDQADSDEQLDDARREVELSRQRLRETRDTVVRPLERHAARNNFAALIASTLTGGRGR